jgi:uncharacterized protein (DUF1684 family)
MRTRRITLGLATGLTMALAALAASAADTAATDYQRSIAEWRAQREAKLKAEDGWLTVVGLTWLKEGPNRVGSNSNSDVRLPKSAPASVGTLTLKSGKVRFTPAPGVAVTMNGAPARRPSSNRTLMRITTAWQSAV